MRRLWAGAEAEAIGWGGVAMVARATGLAISTVRKGRDEAHAGACADGIVRVRRTGGSNSYRSCVWKHELQRVADKLGISIHVSHYPPGTSKWNKVEHRLFSFISINWRGQPLRTYETVVSLIGNTTNGRGLIVRAQLDSRRYPIGERVTDKAFRSLNIVRDEFHGDWNYVIHPRASS